MNTEELIKKQTKWTKAVFAALAVIAGLLIIISALLIPKVYKAVDSVEESLTKVNVLVEDADEAVQNINAVDFEQLNHSIANLNTITTSLASIFNPAN